MAPWSVEFHPQCEQWAHGLDQTDAEALLAAIRVLRDLGPTLAERRAVLLVGGDKSDDRRGWYVKNIPIADERLDAHQVALIAARQAAHPESSTRKKRRR